jgi:hypothetical protein
MKVLEEQITIVMAGHAPTKLTGAAGGSSSSSRLGRETFEGHLLMQARHNFDRKA